MGSPLVVHSEAIRGEGAAAAREGGLHGPVPWGLEESVHACVIEIWGDPPSQVRVQLLLDEDDERPVLLLLEEILTSAA